MKSIIHERPGVYSSYDASAVVWGGRAIRTIGVAARSTGGTANAPVTLTSCEAGISAFGEDAKSAPGMAAMLRLLFLGGDTQYVLTDKWILAQNQGYPRYKDRKSVV